MMIANMQRSEGLRSRMAAQALGSGNAGPHAISRIQAFASPDASGAPYTLLQIETRSGITGYGECKPLSRADVQALSQFVGKPAYAYEALTPLAPPPARGGVNMALLDIVGKATKAPVYRVLGGPTRFKARAIGRLSGSSDGELQQDMQKQSAMGIRAFLVPVVKPPAPNQGSHFVKLHVQRFKFLKTAMPQADFAFAGTNQLSSGDASSLASAIEFMHPLWFDEPCPVTNLDTIRKVASETVVPLGFGRTIVEPGTFQDLLREGLIDLVRPDLQVFGISGVCRIASMAETYYTAVAPWHDAGPISTAAALHAAASMPNFFIFQLPASGAGSLVIRDGFIELPKGPGLGIEVDTKNWERNRIA